jgi:eukaryotic-like serine/threonine-protein kinase
MNAGDRDPQRDREIDRHFSRALELAGPDHDDYLEDLQARDPELALAVARLLAAAASPDPRLDPDRWRAHALWDRLIPDAAPNAREDEEVGPYRIVREVGRGGMSVVYLAERADGLFEQQVALKFLRVAHGVGLRRFERERRILAGLEHPNIARLLDGGADAQGHPYIVMEFVEGRPIHTYCEEVDAGLDVQLELFEAVAEAVEYAHQNLVVHRDIKPSNILVTSGGQVKLLDFGIARFLETATPDEPGAEPLTGAMTRLLTPDYASPEQVQGRRITTASDVYQLGVLLYELLAGRRPFDLRGAGPVEVERIVCNEDPVPPSRAVVGRTSKEGREATGQARSRLLRGDLDTIILKALAKEPARRYASVGELRDDLQRFRIGLPVRARPSTLRYRTSRFVRRHRAGVAAAALVAAALGAGAGVAGWQAVVASAERGRAERALVQAEAVGDFLLEVFEVAAPDHVGAQEVTARELLDRGARRIEDGMTAPRISAALMGVMGQAYRNLGLYEEADPLLARAAELRRQAEGDRDDEAALATALLQLGELRLDQRRLGEAEALYNEALEIRRRVLGPEHLEVAEALRNLSSLRHLQGDMGAAEQLARRVVEVRRRLLGEDDVRVAHALTDLGRVHLFQGDLEAAEENLETAVELQRQLVPAPDRWFAMSLNHLGQVRHNQGRYDDAEALYAEAHSVYTELFGADHPSAADVLNNLGTIHYARGDHEGALAVFLEVLESRRRSLTPDHPLLAHTVHNVASVHQVLGRFDEAEEGFLQALELRRAAYGDEHRDVAMTVWGLGHLYRRQGRLTEAEVTVREALEVYRRVLPPGHASLGAILLDFGGLLAEMGRPLEAEPILEEALAIRTELYGVEDSRTVMVQEQLDLAREALEGQRLAERDGG